MNRFLKISNYINFIKESQQKVKKHIEIYFPDYFGVPTFAYFYNSNINKDLVYLHTAKVACSSLIKSIIDFGNKRIIDYVDLHDEIQQDQFRQYNAKKYKRYTKDKHKKNSNKFTFTFVRNPFSRLVSAYKNKIINDEKPNYDITNIDFINKKFKLFRFKKKESFENFLGKLDPIVIRQNGHFIPLHMIIFYRGKKLVDYIGRFENLQGDYEKIKNKYGTKPLGHLNKSSYKSKKWQDYYTPRLARKVYKLYKKDFDLWYPNAYSELLEYLAKKPLSRRG